MTSEISMSPGDQRKSPASRPGRAGYSDPNKKKYFVFHPTASFPYATPYLPWVNTFGNKLSFPKEPSTCFWLNKVESFVENFATLESMERSAKRNRLILRGSGYRPKALHIRQDTLYSNTCKMAEKREHGLAEM